MKQGSVIFLKGVIFMLAIIVLALCVFWLPWQANYFAETYPEYTHLQYPILIGIYISASPLFFAFYQAYKLLVYIDQNEVFSEQSVRSLKFIKLCGLMISVWYLIALFSLISQNAMNPGFFLMAVVIIFASLVIGIFASVLQKVLQKAIDIKSENDLTV